MKTIIEKYLMKEGEDDKNPNYLFAMTWTELLVKVASKKVDAVMIAKKELANRGIGKNGKWVGHEESAKEWGVK